MTHPDQNSSTLAAAGEASIEVVVQRHQPALDFSTIPLESKASPALLHGDEWDTHRVYFNEFLAPSKQRTATKKDNELDNDLKSGKNRTGNAESSFSFQPFSVESDEDPPVMVEPWTEHQLLNRLEVPSNDALDPLGWPRQTPLFWEEVQEGEDRGVAVTEFLLTDASDFDTRTGGDDENLLGSSLRLRSDADADEIQTNEEDQVPKHNRLEQYAKVEPDEASLAANSSVDDGDDSRSDDADEEQMEVGYRSQDDDEDSEDEEISEQIQGLLLRGFSTGRSNDSDEIEPRVAFATFNPGAQQQSVTDDVPPAFEVTWTETRDEILDTPAHAEATPFPSSSSPPRDAQVKKSVPLLKPPPDEKLQKWLCSKER